jgi:hypothetical protein
MIRLSKIKYFVNESDNLLLSAANVLRITLRLLLFSVLSTNVCFSETRTPDDSVIEAFRALNQDFFRLATGEGKDIEGRYYFSAPHSFKHSDVRLSSHSLQLSAELPIPLSEDFFWRIAPLYEFHSYEFDNLMLENLSLDSAFLHRMELGAGFGYFLQRDLLFTLLLRPGLHSNLVDINNKHFAFYNQGILVYRYEPSLELIAGLVSSERFDEIAVFPVIGLRAHALDNRLHVKITPPVELRLGYSITPGWQVFGGAWLTGNEYRIEEGGRSFKAQIRNQRIGGGVLYWLNHNWNIHIEAGAAIGSKFEFELISSNSGKSLEEGFYSSFSLGYAL